MESSRLRVTTNKVRMVFGYELNLAQSETRIRRGLLVLCSGRKEFSQLLIRLSKVSYSDYLFDEDRRMHLFD